MPDTRTEAIERARALISRMVARTDAQTVGFGVVALDGRLHGGGLSLAATHEVAAATASAVDDAAATLFAAGAAGRLARGRGPALWICAGADLFAPGLEQVGLDPAAVLYADARDDREALVLAEDALVDGTPAVVVAETRRLTLTASRRLQLASERAGVPVLLLRRRRRRDDCPLAVPSASDTRWRVGVSPSEPLAVPGLGRARWSVELVRQRRGDPFSLIMEACDGEGRLALPAAARDRAAAAGGASAARAA